MMVPASMDLRISPWLSRAGIALLALLAVLAAPAARADDPASGAGEEAAPPGLRLALQTETALGVVVGPFQNQLVSGRLDYRFTPTVSLGGSLAYANLKGKDGRAHAVLPAAQLEYVARRRAGSDVALPLRFSTGYLPRNGPVVRAAAGLSWAVSPELDVVLELLAPMVWVTHNQALLSMNVGLEIAWKRPRRP